MAEANTSDQPTHIIIHTHVLNSFIYTRYCLCQCFDIKGQHFSFEGTDTSQSHLIGQVENFNIKMFGSAKLNAIELEAKTYRFLVITLPK